MYLGIIGSPDENSFIKASERKLSFLEFCINCNFNNEAVKEICAKTDEVNEYIKKYDVKVGAVGRWGADKIDANGNIILSEQENDFALIDYASKIGCTVYNTGCNYIEELSYFENIKAAIKVFEALINYGKMKGVTIATYNCRWNNFVHSDRSWTLIHGYLKDLGIKFDPSHCIYAGGDYLSEMKKWGHRFAHVHVKGSLIIDGVRYDDPPAGMDQTNWGAFFAVLYAVGYKKNVSIEPHSSNWKGELGEKGIDFTIDYIKKFII